MNGWMDRWMDASAEPQDIPELTWFNPGTTYSA